MLALVSLLAFLIMTVLLPFVFGELMLAASASCIWPIHGAHIGDGHLRRRFS